MLPAESEVILRAPDPGDPMHVIVLVLALLLGADFQPYSASLAEHPYPHPVQEHTFSARGHDLHMAYMDVAPKEGEPKGTVLLLHGKNFSGAYWGDTIDALVQGGYRVIVPDQVGWGRSSKPLDIQYSFDGLAAWTRDLLDALAVGEVTVVGHSMGGMLATRFALMFPERSARLVLLNPIGLEDWRRLVPYRTVDAWTEKNRASTPEGIRTYMKNSYFDGQWSPEWDGLVAIQAGWALGPDAEHIARVSAKHYDMIWSQPVVHDFSRLAVPTLLVIGTRDRTALNKDLVDDAARAELGRYDRLGREAAAAIPDARLVEVPNVGHLPQVEAFPVWRKALLGFLAE